MLVSILSSFQHLEGQEAGNRNLIHISQCDGALWLLSKLDTKYTAALYRHGNMGEVDEFWYFPLSAVCEVYWKNLGGEERIQPCRLFSILILSPLP